MSDIERRLRFGAVLRVRLLLEGEALEAARQRFAEDADATAVLLEDGTTELGFRGDDAASARLLAESVAAGADRQLRQGGKRPGGALPAGDVPGSRTDGSGVERDMTELTGRSRSGPRPSCRAVDGSRPCLGPPAGIAATGVKELRGRMRGRRAFAILTIYLLLLAGFALMAEKLVESNSTTGFGSSSAFAGAAIGQGIFAALLMLMTLQVVFLAPSSTSGSISLEARSRRSSCSSQRPSARWPSSWEVPLRALVYVFLLIAASAPLDGGRSSTAASGPRTSCAATSC